MNEAVIYFFYNDSYQVPDNLSDLAIGSRKSVCDQFDFIVIRAASSSMDAA